MALRTAAWSPLSTAGTTLSKPISDDWPPVAIRGIIFTSKAAVSSSEIGRSIQPAAAPNTARRDDSAATAFSFRPAAYCRYSQSVFGCHWTGRGFGLGLLGRG